MNITLVMKVYRNLQVQKLRECVLFIASRVRGFLIKKIVFLLKSLCYGHGQNSDSESLHTERGEASERPLM